MVLGLKWLFYIQYSYLFNKVSSIQNILHTAVSEPQGTRKAEKDWIKKKHTYLYSYFEYLIIKWMQELPSYMKICPPFLPWKE